MSTHRDEARELLGAWALDAIDDRERALVERAIAQDTELAAQAQELRETVGLLGENDATSPPAALRDRVLQRVSETTQSAPISGSSESDRSSSATRTRASRGRRPAVRYLAIAAAAAAAIAIPTGIAIDQAGRADRAEEQTQLIAEALASPGAELVAVDVETGGRAVAVLTDESALFAADGLVELQDQDYQLWVISDEEATSAGVLTWQDGQLNAEVPDFPADGALAITAEPLGGSDQPTSDPLAILSRD